MEEEKEEGEENKEEEECGTVRLKIFEAHTKEKTGKLRATTFALFKMHHKMNIASK